MAGQRPAARDRHVRLEYDRRADAIYIRLKEAPIATTREIDDNLIVDLDQSGKMIGIELLVQPFRELRI